MLIQVAPIDSRTEKPNAVLRYTYNAPNDIRVGELVDVPTLAGGQFVGKVTAVGSLAGARLTISHYSGPISPIIGRHRDLHIEVTAKNKADLRRQLEDLIDDLDGEEF